MAKTAIRPEGTPRDTHSTSVVPTTLVNHKELGIVLIDSDTFDPELHTRVDAKGRQIDEAGAVVKKAAKSAETT